MDNVSVLISLTLMCLVFRLISINADPDTDLCADLSVDAAVLADGYQPYVFKGDYYWRLDLELGIVSDYGEKVTDLWPGLPTPIDAAFSIDEKTHRRSTVFIAGEKWYHYKGSKQVNAGNTSQWPNFPRKPIDAAFTFVNTSITSQEYEVYIFYETRYILYAFPSIQEPKFIATNLASTAGDFLYFLVDHVRESETTLKDTVEIKAGVTDKQWIVLFGAENFCRANATWKRHLCSPKPVIDYYKCPRQSRPEVTTEEETSSSESTMTDKTDQTDRKGRTGSTYQEELTSDDSKPSTETLPVEAEQKKESSGKSSSSFLIFVIIFFAIVVIAVVVVVVGFVILKNKRKDTSFKAKPRAPSVESITDDNYDDTDDNDEKDHDLTSSSSVERTKSRKSSKVGSRSDNNDNEFSDLSAKSSDKTW